VYSGGEVDTPTDDGEGEGESDDELDAFAPGADISDELELERTNREKAFGAKEMDPADAEDLREFLEAERRIREEFGSEGEEEVAEEDEDEDEIEDDIVENEGGPEIESDEKEDHCSDDGDQGQFNNEAVYIDSGSEDELATWGEHDEGSTVYAISGDLGSDHHNDPVEIPQPDGTSPPPASSPSPPRRARGRPRKATQSQTSSQPRPKSQSKLIMSPPVVQLHTPPQSSASATGNTPDTFALSPLSTSSPPRTKSKPCPKTKLNPESDPSSPLSKKQAQKAKQRNPQTEWQMDSRGRHHSKGRAPTGLKGLDLLPICIL
jgi:hypothetical protein